MAIYRNTMLRCSVINTLIIVVFVVSMCVSDMPPADDAKDINIDRDITKEPGHMNRFGEGRPSYPVDEIQGFLPAKHFVKQYVFPQKPVIFRAAAGLSPALNLWTDEYFMSLDVPEDNIVVVETKKKENRTQPAAEMHFHKFLKLYNSTDQYMVNDVPEFLLKDLLLPCSIQCKDMYPLLVDAVMWISSGGTKSVVHTDAVENINCLFRGEKEFVMVDPEKYFDKVDLDRPEASYSDMDVDHVDFTIYPGLADVEYFHVTISAGDCLYIPFRWIHQVRSHGSNVAVNVWWDHYKMADVDAESCSDTCDTDLTLDKVEFFGFDSTMHSPHIIRDHVLALIGIHSHISLERFTAVFLEELLFDIDDEEQVTDRTSFITRIFDTLDSNADGKVTQDEVKEASIEVLTKAFHLLKQLEQLVKAYQAEMMANEELLEEDVVIESEIPEDSAIKQEL